MSLTKLTENLNNVSSLPNKPTLEVDELKKMFDESANTIKQYINSTLTEEMDAVEIALKKLIQTNTNTIDINQKNMFNLVYPVGSIYMSVNSINPSQIFGGTWVAWGNGRAVVGIDTSQTEFNTVEKTGGAKTHTLTTSQIPSHGHSVSINNGGSCTISGGAHSHSILGEKIGAIGDKRAIISGTGTDKYAAIQNDGSHSHTVPNHTHKVNQSNVGGNGAHNNLQPYITCYMWKRTA